MRWTDVGGEREPALDVSESGCDGKFCWRRSTIFLWCPLPCSRECFIPSPRVDCIWSRGKLYSRSGVDKISSGIEPSSELESLYEEIKKF